MILETMYFQPITKRLRMTKMKAKADLKAADRLETAVSRNDASERESSEDLPEDQPTNTELLDSVRP